MVVGRDVVSAHQDGLHVVGDEVETLHAAVLLLDALDDGVPVPAFAVGEVGMGSVALEQLLEERRDDGGVARTDLAVDEGREYRLDATRHAHQHARRPGGSNGEQRDVPTLLDEARGTDARKRTALAGEVTTRVGGRLT